ncbi:MAG: threonine--tRNA ligase [Pseudomonadales bacterium]|nr:threonine--tRNA ligase [Pseudomonadales bacterium]MDP6471941.1 threonine--tRNA ligase [Pseudomonadales bacterium]MDP6826789.1 threonine--tRNA ligase [Pseudomonadales bacterium]MDP6970933.1 threonine--tRNA ligase [Pseudomonadales bacterium]
MAHSEHSSEVEGSNELYRIRHSLAHVLAQAVMELRPGSTLGFGPPIADGFYYDFILSEPLTEDDFPELERRMKKILKKGQKFYREDLDTADAMARLEEMGEPYKREYGEELVAKHELEGLSFYRNGPFLDMCEGPHVETTKDIPRDAFKLRSVAGAYWRGDSDNVMMTRIYAWAFSSRETFEEHIARWEDAQARDHKKLGRELGIYAIDSDIGRGLPLWLPNGTVIRDELENLAKELEFKAGYQRVATPHLAKEDFYYMTGHLPYYADDMYPSLEVVESGEGGAGQEVGVVKEAYRLRPMNCPHHHKVFAAQPRSYRDLPLRLAEYGQVYRWEDSGGVSGLLRVRGMCMNDAHIYCTEEQIKDEFKAVMGMYRDAYSILGLNDYSVRLSRWDPEDPKGKDKYVDNPQAWAHSERILTEVLDELGMDYVDGSGEAAFYGPKIDFQFMTVTGREESVSTVQLDFAQPDRVGLAYVGADGQEHVPFCIHRAPLSTHERMVAFLIEHFAGAFPTWLAPLQVQLITVSEHFDDYAQEIVERLRSGFVRAELAPSNDTVPKKIRQGTTQKIPNLVIVGEREKADRTVTLRRYGHAKQHTMPLAVFEETLARTIIDRSLTFYLPEELSE